MEKFLFSKVPVWSLVVLMLVGAIGTIGFGSLVVDGVSGREKFGVVSRTATLISSVPQTAAALLKDDERMVSKSPYRFADKAGWTQGLAGGVPGYLLLSRYDGDRKRAVVELVDMADYAVLHSWWPDADVLLGDADKSSIVGYPELWTKETFRVIHPVLLEDGGLLVKSHASPLMRLDACANLVWRQEQDVFDHSIEPDGAGNYWVPSIIEPSALDVRDIFQDNGITLVTPEGEILLQTSLTQAMIDNGMMATLFTGGEYSDDPIHLNDIEPVLRDGPFWKKGDVFLSLRSKSIVMLYRPATNEIVWHRQGPWMGQHDIDILDDSRISIFNNNVYDTGLGQDVAEVSEVLVYDFATGEITSPYRDALIAAEVKTPYEGLVEILPGSILMVEEENFSRLVFLGPDGGLVAEYMNRAGDGKAYRLGWSRYIDAEYGDRLRGILAESACN